jgi:alkylhydroperoxidase family enzyme
VLEDHRKAPISAAEAALFDFIEKMNANSTQIRQEDAQKLRDAGWTDEAIYDAITVCSLFSFYTK